MATPKASRESWALRGRTISKRYNSYGRGDRWSSLNTHLEIEFSPSRTTKILEAGFRITLRPSPLADWEDGHLDARLAFADEAIEDSPVMLVLIENTPDRALVISNTRPSDAQGFVDNLCFGRDMQFVLQDGDEHLLELIIPNDHSVYDLIRRALQ